MNNKIFYYYLHVTAMPSSPNAKVTSSIVLGTSALAVAAEESNAVLDAVLAPSTLAQNHGKQVVQVGLRSAGAGATLAKL